jgi:hypothetical protein
MTSPSPPERYQSADVGQCCVRMFQHLATDYARWRRFATIVFLREGTKWVRSSCVSALGGNEQAFLPGEAPGGATT